MDSHSYGTPEALEGLKAALAPSDRFLQTEYETIRRLPASRFVLFTIKGFKARARAPLPPARVAPRSRPAAPAVRGSRRRVLTLPPSPRSPDRSRSRRWAGCPARLRRWRRASGG